MKYRTRIKIEYGLGCIFGWILPALLLGLSPLRGDLKFDILFFVVYTTIAFAIMLFFAATMSMLSDIFAARKRIKAREVTTRKGKVVEVTERPDLIIDEPEK